MRINPINIASSNNIVRSVNNAKLHAAKLTFNRDTVSFGANALSYNEVSELKKEAYLLELEAHNNLKTGYDLKEASKKQLNSAKKQYLSAISYIQAYYQLKQSRIDLDDGGYVEFIDNGEKNGSFQIDVYNENGSMVKTISVENSLPSKVVNHLDSKTNIYDYSDGIVVSKGVSLSADSFGECDSIYSFKNGKISSINLKGQILSEPNTFEECYMFFNDKLISYSTDNRIYQGKSYFYGERYTYVNDRLMHYYEDFDGYKDGGMNWKCSYHFANSKLVAKVISAKQDPKKPVITPQSVVYYNHSDDKFLSSNTAKILVSDLGGLVVLEKN